ncbi:MAG: hypothetical protein M4579_006307 [Chaenotheca gracillima]|nr:MAG: hypothetical protein M4579_006307 [Chaenotheca gracillima]
MSKEDARSVLLAHFASEGGTANDKWSQLWDKGDFLPWDRGAHNPALEDTLKDRKDLIGSPIVEDTEPPKRRKRALVPGCGRGYDVLLLASFGYDAYGLDVSESAIKQCREFAKQRAGDYPPRTIMENGEGGVGTITFVAGDFFKDAWVKEVLGEDGTGKFDLIYDYTFLSALPPDLRPAWSLRCSQLLSAQPVGHLICVEFPTYKDPSTKGPPFGLPPKVYVGHLSHPGKNLPYDDQDNLLESQIHGETQDGLDRIAHWQPERTHEIGKGTDWVSIWRHR